MNFFLPILSAFCLLILIYSIFQSKKGNAFYPTKLLYPFGIFVWGDGIVISIFWLIVSLFCLFQKDSLYFWLFVCLFWAIRGIGETIYWLNEQFSERHRNPAAKMIGHKILKNESVYFLYQVFWQCVSVIAIFGVIYISKMLFLGK
ncbi:MAG: hypothetical protein NZM26_04075 [Patescibacteria group bacterium]|nr:hypothetical protein [Patescibacteria group bacterium]